MVLVVYIGVYIGVQMAFRVEVDLEVLAGCAQALVQVFDLRLAACVCSECTQRAWTSLSHD